MNLENQVRSPHPPGIRTGPEKNTLSGAAEATISSAPDPQHPPRSKRRVLLPVLAGLMLVSVGRAAWPVIDISAITQLVEVVRLAQDQLDQVTDARDALFGQVATLTGFWTDLTGEAYELGENASSLTTEFSLTQIEARLNARKTSESNAWPSASDVQNAYAGEDATVIQQVLDAHQQASAIRDAERNAWYDSQIVIAEAGEFLSAVETTASNQNGETTQGLGAQLDRQIAVASSIRDLSARQLEMMLSAEHRAARLDHQRSLAQSRLRQQGLAIRTEIQDSITDYEASFDSTSFDDSLYTPVLNTP